MATSRLCLLLLVALTFPLLGCPDKAVAPLKKVINSRDYNLIDPAESEGTAGIFPGGLLVSQKKVSTFNGLPTGVAPPPPLQGSVSFSAEALSTSTSIQAATTGLEKLIGGNPAFSSNSSSQLTLKQIDASSFKVPPSDLQNLIDNNASVSDQIKKWLSDKRNTVFIVDTVLTTSNISLTKSGTGDVSAAFNGTLVPCPAAGGGAAPAGGATPAATPLSGPGGSVTVCRTSNDVLTLSTANSLAFAAAVRPVTIGVSGKPEVGAVYKLVEGGQANKTGGQSSSNAGGQLPSTWKVAGWPH